MKCKLVLFFISLKRVPSYELFDFKVDKFLWDKKKTIEIFLRFTYISNYYFPFIYKDIFVFLVYVIINQRYIHF